MTNGEKYKTAYARVKNYFMQSSIIDAMPTIQGFASWLDLEAEEEKKPLPCPFCGGGVNSHQVDADDYNCQCEACSYISANRTTKEAAIDAHNSVAKAVRESEGNDEEN